MYTISCNTYTTHIACKGGGHSLYGGDQGGVTLVGHFFMQIFLMKGIFYKSVPNALSHVFGTERGLVQAFLRHLHAPSQSTGQYQISTISQLSKDFKAGSVKGTFGNSLSYTREWFQNRQWHPSIQIFAWDLNYTAAHVHMYIYLIFTITLSLNNLI